VGLITLPYKKRKLLRSLLEIQPVLRRKPRPKLGCGAKERRTRRTTRRNNTTLKYEIL
jgi:hypothetical protein